ncbi:hypothetical protein P879_05118 [Paragonimus westermani]|uniref:SAM domain-containing protein n=1 Tax=Paragonimus westermani TaxID=34504 RepID=A0A8T0D256_9TREM|nr:hypothetical protein P879_05118 [Paragonimus westermani]
MSSENLPTSPKENGVAIPTICLDSLTEGGSHVGDYSGPPDADWQYSDEHSFGTNVAHFFSWLSYYNPCKKFAVATALVAQCDPNLRHAVSSLFRVDHHNVNTGTTERSYFNSRDFDYFTSLHWESLSPPRLVEELVKLLASFPTFTVPPSHSRSLHRLSVCSATDKSKELESTLTLDTKTDSVDIDIHNHYDRELDRMQLLKKHHLRLLADLLCHCNELACMLCIGPEMEQSVQTADDNAIRDLVVQSSIGQLMLKTMLHPMFTSDDRNWMLTVMRTHRRSMCVESVSCQNVCCSSTLHADKFIGFKLFDGFLELASDVASVLQNIGYRSEQFASSLSHSLTSSGFISGGGESGSQYDLLSEATTTNSHSPGGSHYGTLLTVPNTDCRQPTVNAFPNHPCSSHLLWAGNLDHRRLSASPYLLGSSSPTAFEANHQLSCLDNARITDHPVASTASHLSGVAAHSVDCGLNKASQQLSFSQHKPSALSRSSLPNALTPHYPVGTITEQTGDSVSLSSASSTFSSNLDIRATCPDRLSLSPTALTSEATASNQAEALGLSQCCTSPSQSVSAITSDKKGVPIGLVSQSLPVHISKPVQHTTQTTCNEEQPVLSMEGPVYRPKFERNNNNDNSTWTGGSGSSPDEKYTEEDAISVGQNSSYDDPYSGMATVPMWLKSLRLHKYAGLFGRLSYEEFMGITESWLERHNVTQGARTKLLLSICRLHARGPSLSRAERCLLQTPPTSPTCMASIRHCLLEIWNILQTPLKPCSPNSPSTENTILDTDESKCSLEINTHQTDVQTAHIANNAHHTSESRFACTTYLGSDKSRALDETLTPDTTTPLIHPSSADAGECLPDQIMSCLTKVCSRLLVNSQPDLDCCRKFVQLLDVINKHPAFSDKYRSLTASWQQRMFSIQHWLPADPARYSRSVPRSYHMTKSGHKNPSGFKTRQQIETGSPGNQCMEAYLGRSSMPYSSTELFVSASQELSIEPTGYMPQHQIDLRNDHKHFFSEAVSSSGLRRHSIPRNQPQVGPTSSRTYTGRRMPSPNPSFASSRKNTAVRVSHVIVPSTMQTASDVDVSRLAAQVGPTRFLSPSGMDSHFSLGPRRNLAPPATAPSTRMPSPSDVHRQGYFPFDSRSAHAPVCLLHTGQFVCSCSPHFSPFVADDLRVPNSIYSHPSGFSQSPTSAAHAVIGSYTDYCTQSPQTDSSLHPQGAACTSQKDLSHQLTHRSTCHFGTAPLASHGSTPLLNANFKLLSTVSPPSGPNSCIFGKPVPPATPVVRTPNGTSFSQDGHTNLVPGDANRGDGMSPSQINHSNQSTCPWVKFAAQLDPREFQDLVNAGWCAVPNQSCLDIPRVPLKSTQMTGLSGSIGSDVSNVDYIEHDLELLTKNVTELAIGGEFLKLPAFHFVFRIIF